MDTTAVLALAFGIGIVAGLRTFTAPTAVSWAVRLSWLDEAGTRLVRALGVTDLVIALPEDAVALGGGPLLVSRFS